MLTVESDALHTAFVIPVLSVSATHQFRLSLGSDPNPSYVGVSRPDLGVSWPGYPLSTSPLEPAPQTHASCCLCV